MSTYRSVELTKIRQKISELNARLDLLPVGVQSVSVDGTSTTINRKAVLDELDYWNKRAANLAGKRERIATIRLDNSF